MQDAAALGRRWTGGSGGPSQNDRFGVGLGGPSRGGTLRVAGQAPPPGVSLTTVALPAAVSDPRTGRAGPAKVVGFGTFEGMVVTWRTPEQMLGELPHLIKYNGDLTRGLSKDETGDVTPRLIVDGNRLHFGRESEFVDYLRRSAVPLVSAERVDALYRQVLGRGADAGGIKAAQDALAANGAWEAGSLDEVRAGLASSAEAAARVGDLYRAVLGREASAGEVAGFQAALARGGSLEAVRVNMAGSAEARAATAELYRRAVGREAVPDELAGVQDVLARGGSLAAVRLSMAGSAEAQARVSGVFEAVLGRAPEAANAAWMQDALARGGSVAELRAGLAYSAEAAGAIRGVYLRTLGREAEAAGLAHWQERLAGGLSLAEVGAALASSPEAAGRVPPVPASASETTAADLPAASGEGGTAVGEGDAASDAFAAAGFQMPAPAPVAAEVATVEGARAWLARNGLRVGTGLGTAAAVLLTPWNAQTTAVEAGVEGHPEWGARVERAPGSRSGSVVIYERGVDGQPGQELARLGLDVQERLVSPGAEMGGGTAFGAWDSTATVRLGADLEAALVALTGVESTGAGGAAGQEQATQDPAPPSTPPLQTGYSFEIRDAAESAIVAAGQAQNKSQQDIQTELDNHRNRQAGAAGTGGVQGPTDATPDISDPMLTADPARQVMGPGRIGHPAEVNAIRRAMEAAGVTVEERQGALGYAPGLRPGEPGQVLMDSDASYSAWLHEYQHFLDDQAAGWSGMRILGDSDARWQREQNAYGREIEYMRANGYEDAARQLERNMENERRMIFGVD